MIYDNFLTDFKGSKDAVTEVINGKKNISQAQAEALAEFFGVDVGLFIYE